MLGGALVFARRSSATLMCVPAQPKHLYVVEAKVQDGVFQPIISDGASDVQVPRCDQTFDPRQGPQADTRVVPIIGR
jgi:hypothetical protein